VKVYACTSWNEETQTCEVQAWVEQPTVIPPLSVADAEIIAAKIALLWAVAFGLRMVFRMVWRG
jgi:hypothetical protein